MLLLTKILVIRGNDNLHFEIFTEKYFRFYSIVNILTWNHEYLNKMWIFTPTICFFLWPPRSYWNFRVVLILHLLGVKRTNMLFWLYLFFISNVVNILLETAHLKCSSVYIHVTACQLQNNSWLHSKKFFFVPQGPEQRYSC